MRKTTIDEAIARVDDWKGKEISYKPVSGGITNPNFKVDVEGEHFFLKIPGAGTDYINREVCHEANVIADESKVYQESIIISRIQVLRYSSGLTATAR